jgi:tRNA dimethylallyltransferase
VIPVIVGPTASGKSRLAMEIARSDPRVEIVSADSRQIYRMLDIGTAKPTRDEQSVVPHHLIDILDPDIAYAAGEYALAARSTIDAIIARGGRPLVVGGTGFYIRALFEGLSAPAVAPEIYEQLAERERVEGYDALYRELCDVDPDAARAHPAANRQKILRALACYIQTGQRYSSFTGAGTLGAWSRRPRYVGIAVDRAALYERINRRVDTMISQGLLQETEAVLAAGYAPDAPGLRTVGYSELIRHLAGEFPLERAVELIKQSTRRYAKRQMTWFNRVEGIRWTSGNSSEITIE